MCNFTVQISRSWLLQYSVYLTVENNRVLWTNMLTPPYLRLFLQYLAPRLQFLIHILFISWSLRLCSVKQYIRGNSVVQKYNNTSILLGNPLIFWWNIVKAILLLLLDELAFLGWSWFMLKVSISSRFLSPTDALFYYTHKVLKHTVKISLCLLLHVSVQLDHPQGAYAESC